MYQEGNKRFKNISNYFSIARLVNKTTHMRTHTTSVTQFQISKEFYEEVSLIEEPE